MSEKKYAERQAQAAHVIKEQYLLLNQIYNETNNYLDTKKMQEIVEKINNAKIDDELSKADRTIYIMNEYKKMMEAERRRRKYAQLLANTEELNESKNILKTHIKQERKRQGDPTGKNSNLFKNNINCYVKFLELISAIKSSKESSEQPPVPQPRQSINQ